MRNVIKKCSFYRKELRILPMLISIVIFIGCEKNDALDPVEKTSDSSLKSAGTTEPYLTGTFIDFWGKTDWEKTDWIAHILEMKEVGIETLIVQSTSYTDANNVTQTFFNSNDSITTYRYENALENLLGAAEETNVKVSVGLYFNKAFETYVNDSVGWANTYNVNFLERQATLCKNLATQIQSKYGANSSFAGWYISYEPAPSYYRTNPDGASVYVNHLIQPIVEHLNTISPEKSTSIAALFNPNNSTTTNELSQFMDKLAASDLDIIMLQDGTGANDNGVPHVAINQLDGFYKSAHDGLYSGSHIFSGEFWSDLETFNASSSPETFSRVKQKLDIESKYVSKIVSFQYYKDMRIDANDAANDLRSQYFNYYEAWQ